MLELNKDNFKDEVLEAEGHVLVDYWSPSCGPCKALMPHIENLSKEYGDKIKFATLNTSKARRLAISEKIMGLPTINIYKDGKKIDSVAGDKATEESVKDLVEKYA